MTSVGRVSSRCNGCPGAEYCDNLDRLAMEPEDVAKLTRPFGGSTSGSRK